MEIVINYHNTIVDYHCTNMVDDSNNDLLVATLNCVSIVYFSPRPDAVNFLEKERWHSWQRSVWSAYFRETFTRETGMNWMSNNVVD